MSKTTGLGKGLSSLIPTKIDKNIFSKDSAIVGGEEMIIQLPLGKIKANPHQPRSNFDHESLEDLTNSIKEHGILQPLILTPDSNGYQLIAGERRFRAAQILGLKTVPSIIREVKEQQKLELALVENIQRKDLNAIEEAVAYQRLIDEFNLTQEAAAKRVGKSRSVVANTLRLLTLPTEIQRALINEKINYSTARLIVGLPVEKRLEFFKKILKNDLTVRAAEGQARKVIVKRHFRKAKDPNIASMEDKLQAALGTKVTVKKSGETGQIIIEFYSAEELGEIVGKIGG
jgi:ParB family chromosome partitioning protein